MPETTLDPIDRRRRARRLAGHEPFEIARLQPADYDAIVAMLGRCSPASVQRRFHANTDGVPYVTRLLADATSEVGYGAWLAGRCIGLASLHAYSETGAEIGVLVEDAWQQRGVGSALVSALARDARQRGWNRLRAEVLADNHFIPAALTRMGSTRTSVSFGVYTVLVDLEGVA
jgi:GNAT superfamily N-acetyltransferase